MSNLPPESPMTTTARTTLDLRDPSPTPADTPGPIAWSEPDPHTVYKIRRGLRAHREALLQAELGSALYDPDEPPPIPTTPEPLP